MNSIERPDVKEHSLSESRSSTLQSRRARGADKQDRSRAAVVRRTWLAKPQSRSRGGYRLYGVAEVDRVRLIDALQSVGMSLTEIAELVDDYESAAEREIGVVELRAAYKKRLRAVNEKIELLMAMKVKLTNGINFLDGCVPCQEQSADCACRDCDRLATDESGLLMVTRHDRVIQSVSMAEE